MSNITLSQILSKIRHGTIIRHSENFERFTRSSYENEDRYWVRVGKNNNLFLSKKEYETLKPFVCYCIYFKIKGKTGFYHCEENGLFDMRIQFSTLSQFAMKNMRSIYPKFNTMIDCFNHLEYYCKTTKQWIKLCDYQN